MTSKRTTHGAKSKTIRPPGSATTRVSVACDRCRKKKIRCFYDEDDKNLKPGEHRACANCKAVGLECIFTDKLARKAFPRGYTESLEERVRELEFENKKLQRVIRLRGSETGDGDEKHATGSEIGSKKLPLSDENLTRLNQQQRTAGSNSIGRNAVGTVSTSAVGSNTMGGNDHSKAVDGISHGVSTSESGHPTSPSPGDVMSCGHLHDESCSCGYAHSIHNRPVSIAGSIDVDHGELSDDDISLYSVPSGSEGIGRFATTGVDDLRRRYGYNSFEQVNAPGAAAAISLQNKLRTKNFMNLANLIAASIPRSTEETLFIPTLLAKIVSVHGFNSKAPYLTARSIALLKDLPSCGDPCGAGGAAQVNFHGLRREQSAQFFRSLQLPGPVDLDLCVAVFFDTWNTIVPVLNRDIFMNNYVRFSQSRQQGFLDGKMVGFEKFGELVVIIVALVMVGAARECSEKKRNPVKREQPTSPSAQSSAHSPDLSALFVSSPGAAAAAYDSLIKQLIHSNINSMCSISSLQMVTIELLYCLTTGDLATSYFLRGKMVTMSQQLRLQRCPAAVLGYNGSNVSKVQQGERRILFWCSYTLDAFSAFILGVPRLFKDDEIECALPASSNGPQDSDANLITFNNIQLSLVGKVCDAALSVMRYARILGTVVDHIFKRSNSHLKKPSVDEGSCLVLEDMLDSWRRDLPASVSFDRLDLRGNASDYAQLNNTQLTLLYLYYQAKALIYMPLMAAESHANSKTSPAFISIQQATTALLTATKVLSSSSHNYYYMPLPMNLSRQKARFVLLAAKTALEYTRGGALFQEAKSLIACAIRDLQAEAQLGVLGCLSMACCSCLEKAVDAILSQPRPGGALSPEGLAGRARSRSHSHSSRAEVGTNDGIQTIPANHITPRRSASPAPALNDIFSKAGFQVRTLQQQMRQPRRHSVSSHTTVSQPVNQGLNQSALNQPVPTQSMSNKSVLNQSVPNQSSQQWGNWGNFADQEERQLNQNLQASGGDDMMRILAMSQQQEDRNLNDILRQAGTSQADGTKGIDYANLPGYTHPHSPNNSNAASTNLGASASSPLREQSTLAQQLAQSQSVPSQVQHASEASEQTAHSTQKSNQIGLTGLLPSDNVKSYSDLLMLNDFGVDASLGLPLLDFELDGPKKKPRIDSGASSSSGDISPYNSMLNWH